ncbi:hypothetical protein AK88_03033 [Plasmodium fragile]|uniref:Uncharacterized protein n=1 Tax=Plasmodium fragile TaxID=5857 RepID=A0A0D9QK66_PLAFR|nr:uncharacterized protein AK88_03033 [Plasmodium fragile]KJP87353.1 hypothetical protein AK88_03033 [Plasmodium fragile]
MYYQKEIIKWLEQKNKLKKGKRSGRYVLLRFKRAVRESLWGELLCKVSLDGGVTSPTPGHKLISGTAQGMIDGSLYSLAPRGDPPTERTPKVRMLKRTIQNFHNVRLLLGRNDPVCADLARVFSQELQEREGKTLNSLEENQPNGANSLYDHVQYLPSEPLQRGVNDTLDIVDLMHLFNFYTSIEWHRFNFLIIILRCIISMGRSMADTNEQICVKFLQSCVNLRIEIKKNLKSQKGRSIWGLNKGAIHWGKFDHFGLVQNRVPSIHVSPCQMKRLNGKSSPKWSHSPKGLHNKFKLSQKEKNALQSLPPCGRGKSHLFHLTYAKWMKRKFKLELEMCNRLMEDCAYMILGRGGQLNDTYMKYVKVLHRGRLYLNGDESLKSFTAKLADYINAKCEYLSPDELISAVHYLTNARREAKRDTKVVDPKASTIQLTRAITRISQHLCISIQKKTNEYTVGEVCKVLSLCARNKHYDMNLLDGVTAYVVENLDQVSSRRLTRLAINIHDMLGYTHNGLLLAIVNRYRPPRPRGASRRDTPGESRSIRGGKRTHKRGCDKLHTIQEGGDSAPETVPRRNFQNVKISQLLRFIKVLIKNDIHLDEEWAHYFLSLIKKKFTHISRKDFPLLCYTMLHIQSREIIPSFFNPSSRYHIYKYFPVDQLANSLRLTPLIQIMLLLSTHIHHHNRRIFFCFFFKVLKKFCLQTDIPQDSSDGEEAFTHGDAFTGMSSSPHVRNDQSRKNVPPELSFYMHNLNFYERGNNNKYDKKKKKKKKQRLQNYIAKVPIPTCEEMKEKIIPFIKLTQPDYQRDVIMDETDGLRSNQGRKTACVYTVTTLGGDTSPNQQNNVKNKCSTRVTVPLGGDHTHRGDSPGGTNHSHVVMPCYTVADAEACMDATAKSLPKKTPLRLNNTAIGSRGRTTEPPMKKQSPHEGDYFENLANARSILWAIQNVLLHLAEENPNDCLLEDGSHKRCLSSRLNELTFTQLSLLHRTYALGCSYIDSSLSAQRSLNNERVVASSKLHKQVLSILAHMTTQDEIISELVHHPFQVDICLRRKPC